jgi:hypothetical protein
MDFCTLYRIELMKSEDTPIRDDNTANKAGDIPALNSVKHDIPKFDLSEQILAGQRKFSSIKRKAPVKNRISNSDRNSNIESNNSNPIPKPIPEPVSVEVSSCDKIISEIVARDIRNIRAGRIAG